jgi:sortase A
MSKSPPAKQNRALTVIAVILIIAGVGIVLFPWGYNKINERNALGVIQQYEDASGSMTEQEIEAQLEAARAYNAQISTYVPYDPFAEDPGEVTDLLLSYDDILDPAGSGIMAVLKIPKMDMTIPVYHGVSEYVLQKGAGHMPTTALPVGGAGTHCVVAGHRGLISNLCFTNLDVLEVGDAFYFDVLGHKLGYRVDQILTVDPENLEALLPVQGEDYVTLATCAPYMINSHRLFVRGTRDDSVIQEDGPVPLSDADRMILTALIACAAAIAIVTAVILRRKKRPRTGNVIPAPEPESTRDTPR